MIRCSALLAVLAATALPAQVPERLPYPIVDTGQARCYGNQAEIAYPEPGQPF